MEVTNESNPKILGLCQQKATEKFYFISDFIGLIGRNFSLFDSDEVQQNSRKQSDSEIEAFAQLGVSRGLDSKEAHYLANLYGSNAPKVFALAHSLEQAPGLSLADTLSLHYAMRNELALSPVDFLLRRTNHMLFMRDSLDSIVEPVLDEMGRFYDWTEEEKATYRADVEAALANNDLAELKN
ncbi:glycerol-3-phosphate dehydrogenase%2C truncation [Streptococcus pneumoniae]|nr:glycerol-3-phosphate dehydrogenase%2C truncation [Streptococcus pneumoniae]